MIKSFLVTSAAYGSNPLSTKMRGIILNMEKRVKNIAKIIVKPFKFSFIFILPSLKQRSTKGHIIDMAMLLYLTNEINPINIPIKKNIVWLLSRYFVWESFIKIYRSALWRKNSYIWEKIGLRNIYKGMPWNKTINTTAKKEVYSS